MNKPNNKLKGRRIYTLDEILNDNSRKCYSREDMEEAFTNGLNRSFDSDFDRWFYQFNDTKNNNKKKRII